MSRKERLVSGRERRMSGRDILGGLRQKSCALRGRHQGACLARGRRTSENKVVVLFVCDLGCRILS